MISSTLLFHKLIKSVPLHAKVLHLWWVPNSRKYAISSSLALVQASSGLVTADPGALMDTTKSPCLHTLHPKHAHGRLHFDTHSDVNTQEPSQASGFGSLLPSWYSVSGTLITQLHHQTLSVLPQTFFPLGAINLLPFINYHLPWKCS